VGRLASGGENGVAVGYLASCDNYGVAVGRQAAATFSGVAVGDAANGDNYGVAVGYLTDGNDYGVAVGRAAIGTNYGVAVGRSANGANYGVAVGYNSSAVSNSVAIGQNVANTEPNSTKIKGTLNMGGQAVTNVDYVQTTGGVQIVCAFSARPSTPQTLIASWNIVNFGTEIIDVGGKFASPYWTPPKGWCQTATRISLIGGAANWSGRVIIDLGRNSVSTWKNMNETLLASSISIVQGGSTIFYNDNATNRFFISLFQGLGESMTNNVNFRLDHFSGVWLGP